VIAFENATGSTEIADYRGLVKRSPALAGVLLIGLLSLAAIPGTAGFMGKFLVFGSAIQMGVWQALLLAVVGILTSVVAAFYYLNVVRQIFFEPAEEGASSIRVPPGLLAGMAVTVTGILVIGLYPEPFIQFANQAIHILQQVF
jgi:NADH:ubiquinone oxidoreductase subunit 2 (subunit N)